MNIKDLYIQSYVGGTGLAKKEALALPFGWRTPFGRKVMRLITGLRSPKIDLVAGPGGIKSLPQSASFAKIDKFGNIILDSASRPDFSKFERFFNPATNDFIIPPAYLNKHPEMIKEINALNKMNWGNRASILEKPSLFSPSRFSIESIISTLMHTYGRTPVKNVDDALGNYLYKGYTGMAPLSPNPLNGFHSTLPKGKYLTNQALWFAPNKEVADRYAKYPARFRLTPNMRSFVEKTTTPHLGSSPAWDDRMTGKARQDALTKDMGDPNFEVVLPRSFWNYWLKNPSEVVLQDANGMYRPRFRRQLLQTELDKVGI